MTRHAHSDHPLFSLSPHAVYWLADGMRTRRGLDYLQRRRVLDFSWDKKSGRLRAVVLGTRRYAVMLDAVDGRLRCQCGCDDASRGAVCKHAVAAAAAFFAVTRGTRFLHSPPPRDYLEALRKGIEGETNGLSLRIKTRKRPAQQKRTSPKPAVEAGLGMVCSDGSRWRVIGLRVSGDSIKQEHWDPDLQRTVLRMNVGTDVCGAVFGYLEEPAQSLPVWISLQGKWHRLNGVCSGEMEVAVSLTRQKGEVTAAFEFEPHGGVGGDPPEVVCGLTPQVGITRNARLVRLNAAPSVRALGILPRVLFSAGRIGVNDEAKEPLPYQPWTLPADIYNSAAEVFFGESSETGQEEPVRFFEGKRKAKPKTEAGRFGLHFDRDEDDPEGYVVTVHWEGPGFSVPLEAGAQTLDHRMGAVPERRLFAKRKRASHLAQTLAALAGEPDRKERKKLADEAVRREHLPDRKMAHSAKFLFRALEEEFQAECRWVFAHPGSGRPTPWVETEMALREVLFWELFLTALFVPEALRERFRGAAALTVSREALAASLPGLFRECRERGAALLVEGRPVGTTALEVAVAVKPSAEKRDWFELRPEIRLGGKTLSQEDWEAIAERNGVIPTAKGPLLIDIDSLERLKKARALLESRDDEEAGADGIEVPRLQVFEWLDLKRYGIKLKLPKEGRRVLESLARFRKLEPAPLPAGLHADLRDYQKSGYDWLVFLYRHRFGACLADDMGLGKTVQAIALFVALKEGTGAPGKGPSLRRKGTARLPHLVVAPASLMFNWRSEIERFAPVLAVHEYTGTERSSDFAGADVVLTTYEIARRDRAVLRERRFHVLVFDEAQAVKNRAGRRHKAARELPAEFRVCLTGTPVENHLGEYRAILDLALPGIFRDLDAKKSRTGAEAIEHRVLARSRPFVLRRTKTAVLSQLPAKTETDIMLDLSARQKALYVREVARVRAEVAAAYNRMSAAQAGVAALSALNRLRLLCVSPALLDPKEPPVSPKFDYALDAVTELLDEGNAVLVFSQFVKALNLFDARLKQAGFAAVRLEGKTTRKQRKDRVQRFQSGEGPSVFLLSLKAGGVGLNLTRANHVIHLDPWWNPAVESQASDRAHRIGQERKVLIQRLSMRGTIEEKIAALKADKKELYRRVLGSDEKPRAAAGLTREDLGFLLDEDV